MRWGNVNEMIEQNAKDLCKLLKNQVKNDNKNINFIDGANHGYTGKEEILAEEILKFISNN